MHPQSPLFPGFIDLSQMFHGFVMILFVDLRYFAGYAGGQTVTSIKEVTYCHARRRTIKWRRTGVPPLCAICGTDTELISMAAAARCAGVSPEALGGWLECFQEPAGTPFQQKTLVCLGCLSKHQKTGSELNSTE
jgi:hypothetical protein